MTDKAISALRRRLIEDMAIRRLGPETQQHFDVADIGRPRRWPCRQTGPGNRQTF